MHSILLELPKEHALSVAGLSLKLSALSLNVLTFY